MEKISKEQEEMLVDMYIFLSDFKKKEFMVKDICSSLNIGRTHPYLWTLLSMLLDKKIFRINNEIGNVKLYKGDKKKLRDLIDELPFVSKINEEYNQRAHIRPY